MCCYFFGSCGGACTNWVLHRHSKLSQCVLVAPHCLAYCRFCYLSPQLPFVDLLFSLHLMLVEELHAISLSLSQSVSQSVQFYMFLAYNDSIVNAENMRAQGNSINVRMSSRTMERRPRIRAAVCAAQNVHITPSTAGRRPLRVEEQADNCQGGCAQTICN